MDSCNEVKAYCVYIYRVLPVTLSAPVVVAFEELGTMHDCALPKRLVRGVGTV